MNVKEQFSRYIFLKKEVENRLECLARMRADAQLPNIEYGKIGSNGGDGQRMARAVERCMEYAKQIEPVIAANRQEMHRIQTTINQLDDPLEREVLRMRYLDGQDCRLTPWKEIALALYGDDDECCVHACIRLQSKALKKAGKYLLAQNDIESQSFGVVS